MREELIKDRNQIISFFNKKPSPVVDTTISNPFNVLNTNTYQKGGWILHMLRDQLSDPVFQKVIREFYRRHRNGNALSKDLVNVVNQVSNRDFSSFFDQWLYRSGYPVLEMEWTQNDQKIMVQIDQKQSLPFSFPLELGMKDELGELKIYEVGIDETSKMLTFYTDRNVKEIILDPRVKLLFLETGS